MAAMTYERRKRAIFEFLYRDPGGLLHRYRLPEHLSDNALRDEVNLLVEDINGIIPSDYAETDMTLLTPEINGAVRRRHGAQGWPPAKVMIAATEDAVAASAQAKAANKTARSGPLDPFEAAAAAMKAKQPVGEQFLWGAHAVEMISRGLIDSETMGEYRSGAFLTRRAHYGEQKALTWEDEAKERHRLAKEAFRSRREGDGAISEEVLREGQEELKAAARSMDRRSSSMRRYA
ncbi:hypothetical protein [Thalassobacter stenotrophicus]|uniref:Uncharacterized protein n=2 Tax=Thalassobacter stenotrophicus TaxID=266809 RepID=A0A0N7LTB8_9RHOB|nr:hypothetical protein [Thalassobacter stenotrophicus]CUH60258.1 hypothetical protein THS5294_01547 [Thalassobacter stenotrophicus]SHI71366.1 hypothetical protein SAMN02744035_01338 [Thalassobacter stenotrophicus DSM 16310]